MKILIIEDEKPAALQLAKLISELSLEEKPIIETLDSVESAVQWLRTFSAPDLVFMDIQIADGLSFDIFKHIKNMPPVIFTTAYDQYAVKAFKVNAVDYLLKPVDPEELQKAVDKVLAMKKAVSSTFQMEILERIYKKEAYKERFLIKIGQNMNILPTKDIAYFYSENSLSMAATTAGKQHFIENTLDELEKQLDPAAFFRVGRAFIVRHSAIEKISPYLNSRLVLQVNPPFKEEIIVSREKVQDFKAWLGG